MKSLCQKKDQHTPTLTHENPASPDFLSAQDYLVKYMPIHAAVRSALQFSSTSDQNELFAEATNTLETLCSIVQNRYDSLAQHEIAIGKIIALYAYTSKPKRQDDYFSQALTLCGQYAPIIHFNETLLHNHSGKSSKKELYLDLNELSFLADPQLRQNYQNLVAQANSEDQFKTIHKEVQDITHKEQLIRKKLHQKYSKSLSESERTFLETPATFYRVFTDNLNEVCQNVNSYLARKSDLHKESSELDSKINELHSTQPALTAKYFEQLYSTFTLPPSPFDKLIFLAPQVYDCHQKKTQLEKIIQEKKHEVSKLLDTQMQQMETYLANTINECQNSPGAGNKDSFRDIINIADALQSPHTPRMREIYRTLDCLDAYHHLENKTSPDNSLMKSKNGSTPRATDNVSNTQIRYNAIPISTNPASLAVVKSTVINSAVIDSNFSTYDLSNSHTIQTGDSPKNTNLHQIGETSELDTASQLNGTYQPNGTSQIYRSSSAIKNNAHFSEELIILAFKSVSDISNPALHKLCSCIAGYDGQNLSLCTASERRHIEIPNIDVGHLNETDRKIFDSIAPFLIANVSNIRTSSYTFAY